MTDLEALVSIAMTAMRARGQWCDDGIDDVLRRDIRAMVSDCAMLLGLSADDSKTIGDMAIRELELRAASSPRQPQERRPKMNRFSPAIRGLELRAAWRVLADFDAEG